MDNETSKRLTQLKAAFDGGLLDADTYRSAVDGLAIAGMNAQQSGSGALAQSGGTAAGAGGLAVGGDIHGNIYMGAPPADERQALAIYRRVFVSSARALPLRGVDIHASDPTSEHKAVDLDAVYVGPQRPPARRPGFALRGDGGDSALALGAEEERRG